MMTRFGRSVAILSLASLFAFGGCSDETTLSGSGDGDVSGGSSLETLDLDAEYGDLAFTDEAVAFGDPQLLAATLIDEAALSEDDEDSLNDDDPSLTRPMMARTYLRILWGQLEGRFDPADGDRPELERLDWTGVLSVSAGAIAMKRTVLFERPYDHLLPRTSRDSLEWVSHTGPHFDGLLVCIVSPVVDGVAQGELTFATGPFTTTVSVADLDGIDRKVDVDNLGNAVSFLGRKADRTGCGAGFLGGLWKNTEDRPETEAVELGVFRGRFAGEHGMVHGFLQGVYGLNTSGERVFIGKYIGRDGRIRGLIRGTWTPAEDAEGMGSFQGRWVGRNGEHRGELQGRYRAGEHERADGFFQGLWKERCMRGDA